MNRSSLPTATTTVAIRDEARLTVHVVGAMDDVSRPLAVLQHGFPDTPATWRHLAPLLVASGYRVAMPWLRGYPPSRAGRERTTIARYATDLNELHDALGGDGRAVLVGHDWGAAAAWSAGVDRARWSAVVGIAVPPQPAMHGFLTDLDQLWRSRYQLLAQLPIAGWTARRDLAPLVTLWRRWSPGYVPTSDDLTALRESLGTAKGIAGALAPYRAHRWDGILGRVPAADGPVPDGPCLVIHGRDDACIDQRYAIAARPLLAAGHPLSTVWLVSDAGHFAHLERPDVVSEAIVAFLSRVRAAVG